MPPPQILHVENRLSSAVDAKQGKVARDLVKDSDERIEAMRSSLETYVQTRLTHLLDFKSAPEETLFAESRVLGAKALEIAEVAGAAKMVAIGEIARGISAMVDSFAANGAWHGEALRVHLQALFVTSAQGSAEMRSETIVLDRLRVMRAVLGISE